MGGLFIVHQIYIHTQRIESKAGLMEGGQWRPGYGKSRAEAERSTLLPLFVSLPPPPPTAMADPIFM
jgi:hypothetical protein